MNPIRWDSDATCRLSLEAFDECVFFTHSIWYALLLFVSEEGFCPHC